MFTLYFYRVLRNKVIGTIQNRINKPSTMTLSASTPSTEVPSSLTTPFSFNGDTHNSTSYALMKNMLESDDQEAEEIFQSPAKFVTATALGVRDIMPG